MTSLCGSLMEGILPGDTMWLESNWVLFPAFLCLFIACAFLYSATITYRRKRRILHQIGDVRNSGRVLQVLGFKRMGDEPTEGAVPRSCFFPEEGKSHEDVIWAHDDSGYFWAQVVREESRTSSIMIEDILLNHCFFKRETVRRDDIAHAI